MTLVVTFLLTFSPLILEHGRANGLKFMSNCSTSIFPFLFFSFRFDFFFIFLALCLYFKLGLCNAMHYKCRRNLLQRHIDIKINDYCSTKQSVIQTAVGEQVEYTKVLKRTMLKKLGNYIRRSFEP